MYMLNGRAMQVGRDNGRSLGFYGVGACDPTNDLNCLQNLDSSSFNTPMGTGLPADESSVTSSSYVPPLTTTTTPAKLSTSSSGSLTTYVMIGGAALLLLMLAGGRKR